jgi:ribosomal protein L7/L12
VGVFGGSAQDQVDLDGLRERVVKLEAAVTSLQAQVAALASGAPPNPLVGTDPGSIPYGDNVAGGPWLEEVRALKHSGNVISAIKLYREHTGLGLKEAKDAVEGLV